jgi:hypothetical protein
MNFIFFSFNQKLLGPLNESVLGARKVSCQMAIYSLATTAWQSPTFVFHPAKQLSNMFKGSDNGLQIITATPITRRIPEKNI